jgi:betaine-aldehyde dehydrogenase
VLRSGGKRPEPSAERPAAGYFYEPTVLDQCHREMKVVREEVFGPVLTVETFRTEDEAVALANDTEYGLAGGVWSADPARAEAVARRLRTGQVEVNGGRWNPVAPFGGYKQSGNSRELGRWGLEEYMELKAIQR